jgi:hypothetical protein
MGSAEKIAVVAFMLLYIALGAHGAVRTESTIHWLRWFRFQKDPFTRPISPLEFWYTRVFNAVCVVVGMVVLVALLLD